MVDEHSLTGKEVRRLIILTSLHVEILRRTAKESRDRHYRDRRSNWIPPGFESEAFWLRSLDTWLFLDERHGRTCGFNQHHQPLDTCACLVRCTFVSSVPFLRVGMLYLIYCERLNLTVIALIPMMKTKDLKFESHCTKT